MKGGLSTTIGILPRITEEGKQGKENAGIGRHKAGQPLDSALTLAAVTVARCSD